MDTGEKIGSPLLEIPGHLLAEIFLRLPSAEDLARTAAACPAFRGLVADGAFLRRFRRLHPPPVLGFYNLGEFHPAPPPCPSAPAARALALAADFSFSFLPSHCSWTVRDIRDGRVLLYRKPGAAEERQIFTEVVVCDPLHRRYILLPPVPQDLVVPVDNSVRDFSCVPSLIPSNEEETEETAFRVIWLASWGCNLAVRIFSSSTGQWQSAAYQARSEYVIGVDALCFRRRHFAGGCIYWNWVLTEKKKKLLVFDTRTMEFSVADSPPGEWGDQRIAIMDAGEGRVGIFGIRDGDAGVESVLSYMVWQNKGESSGQLKEISLGYGYLHFVAAATKNCLILLRLESRRHTGRATRYADFVSLDVQTMQLERMFPGNFRFVGRLKAHIYANFPPSLSSPTI